MNDNIGLKNIVRFGTVSDQKDLANLSQEYDEMIVNANMLAHVTSSISRFLLNNICLKENKGYFIDPITYAFQDHLELLHSKVKGDGNRVKRMDMPIKPPFRKLIDYYGEMVRCVDSNIVISSTDFRDNDKEEKCREFCERVMDFQWNTVVKTVKEDELEKYIDYIDCNSGKEMKKNLYPDFVIAPYFYLQLDTYLEWLNVNIKLARMSIEIAKDTFPVWTQLLISKEILANREILTIIGEAYKTLECFGIILWIDDFDEIQASGTEIENYMYLLNLLKKKNIYLAYGGFFSCLLGHKDLKLVSGVSHGLEYGESRGGYPVGGGLPVSRYYYLPLHRRLKYSESYDLLEKLGYILPKEDNWGNSNGYFKDICKCKMCKELLDNSMIGFKHYSNTSPYEVHYKNHTQRRLMATKDEKRNCRYHYMYCKHLEQVYIKRRELKAILEDLEVVTANYNSIIDTINLETMQKWIEEIRKVKRKSIE